jgi:hypothetical protein
MMEEEIARKAEAKPALAVHKPKSLFAVAGPRGASAPASAAAKSGSAGIDLGSEFDAWTA